MTENKQNPTQSFNIPGYAHLRIAHINDTHSHFEPTALQLELQVSGKTLTPFVSVGGFARIATRAGQLKQAALQAQREFLFLHAGDCFQGTLFFSLFKGRANADLLNALQIDAMALGNHELDMGNDPVAQFLPKINFPLLAGNWDVSNENQHKPLKVSQSENLYSYNIKTQSADWIVKYANEQPVAIFGLSIDQMNDISNPDPDTHFINAIEVAQNTVAKIHAQGIKNIILLSHLGYEQDIELAQQISGIGLVIGGHSHRLQGDFSDLGLGKDVDDYGVNIDGTYVVQAGFHAQTLGHCDIVFDPNGKVVEFNGKNEWLFGRRLCLDASLNQAHTDESHQIASQYIHNHPQVVVCKKDQQVNLLLNEHYIPKVREKQTHVIGHFSKPMRHVRIPDEQGPSELAPMVAESFYWKMQSLGHPVDFAIHNAGGVRASLPAGPVTTGDIAGKLVPFLVPIGVYQIQGRYIAHILEGAINNALNNGVIGTGSGSYPYAYNLKFDYEANAPKGQRVQNLKWRNPHGQWRSISSEDLYWGTSSAYTMKGKEGYDAILNMQQHQVTNASMADCMLSYLQENQNVESMQA